MPDPKHKPIILDRSRLQQYADCPLQGYLSILWDALKAIAGGYEVFPWEQKLLDAADPELIKAMQALIQQSTTGRLAECGTQIHGLIEKAFRECENDVQQVPQWFVDNLPKMQPNISKMAEKHARHVGDMVANYHVNLIGIEVQVSLILIEETETTPAVIGTTRIDLLGSGRGNLHVVDWKTGFKQRSNSATLDSFQAGFIALLLFCQKEYAEIGTVHFWYYETMFGTKAYARFNRNDEHPRLPGLTTLGGLRGRAKEAALLFQSDCRDAWPLPDTCCWCDMIRFCPQASMEAKEIADDPAAFVDNLVVLKALCSTRKRALTAYIKGHGAVEGSKVVYTQKKPSGKFLADFEDKDKPQSGPTGNPDLDSHFS